jgi:hypothetical protein
MLRSARHMAAGSLCLVAFTLPALAANPIGKVVATAGAPSASGPGGSRDLGAGSDVYEDDKVMTGSGNVQIIFIDRTRLVIGPHSSLKIERFLLRGGRSVRRFSIDVLRGTFRFLSGSSRKSAYNITTANSTIRLQGTAFDIAAGSATLIAVYSGKASLCAYGQCESVDQYCGVARARGGDVRELKGRAKARALSALPYVESQGRLAPAFRLDTSGCRIIIDGFLNGLDRGSKRDGEAEGRRPGGGPPNPQPQ